MSDRNRIRLLLELIQDLVSRDHSPWREKRDAIRAEASRSELDALAEFTAWFDPEEAV